MAGGGEVVGGYPECVLVDVGQDHGGPGLSEGPRGGQSHAGAGAGDQGDLASEVVARVHEATFLVEGFAEVADWPACYGVTDGPDDARGDTPFRWGLRRPAEQTTARHRRPLLPHEASTRPRSNQDLNH